jgi:hypothetical protein
MHCLRILLSCFVFSVLTILGDFPQRAFANTPCNIDTIAADSQATDAALQLLSQHAYPTIKNPHKPDADERAKAQEYVHLKNDARHRLITLFREHNLFAGHLRHERAC